MLEYEQDGKPEAVTTEVTGITVELEEVQQKLDGVFVELSASKK